MRRINRRTLACIVLAACVFTGSFGLGGLHLVRSRAAVMDAFYGGAEPAQPGDRCMNALLNRAGQCARIMAEEARRYLGADHAAALNMLASAEGMVEGAKMDDRYGAYVRIRSEADSLCNAMCALNILDGERANFKRAYDEFWRCDSSIRREPYREMAEQYNRSIEGFPAAVVAKAFGASKLTSFSG